VTDSNGPGPSDIVELFQSLSRPKCEERVLVLQSVGIGSQLVFAGGRWHLFVAAEEASFARQQLDRYERENPPRPVPATPAAMQPYAGLGSLAYALVLLLVGYLAGVSAFDLDWLDAGALRAGEVQRGELWRSVTALTLHLDVAHLIANLGFGMLFGYFAGQLLGPGVAWASILGTAAAANLFTALVQTQAHSSAGASTAVFATLGLLAAYGWRQRHSLAERWAYRYAPIVAGVALLAFLGVGGERTDVLAHLAGFVSGAIAGWWHGRASRGVPLRGGRQLLLGLVTIAVIVAAWSMATVADQAPRVERRAFPVARILAPSRTVTWQGSCRQRRPGMPAVPRPAADTIGGM
jgi:membrane associated rhomboid family serine protease